MSNPTKQHDVLRKVAFRLLPMLMVLYFLNYLDKVNVGFAALEMNADIGLSSAAYGLGAGLFFVGYFFFEVPSNLLLTKFGARIWITRIVLTWGVIAASMSLVQGETSFYILRFLLGVAEAGFFPGIVYLLGVWFPRQQRARILSYVYAAAPVSFLLGSPVSAFLMDQGHGFAGMPGWRFMFAAEGLVTVVAGIVAFFVLVDRPTKAKWLTAQEGEELERRVAAEDAAVDATHNASSIRSAFTGRVFLLSFVYFGIAYGIYAVGFFLPQAIKGFEGQFGLTLSGMQIGLMSAIPYGFATAAMLYWSRRSDARGERIYHVLIPALVGGVALTFSFALGSPFAVMAGITVAAIGMFCCIPVFWQIPASFLTGAAAAAGIGVINSIGNLSGFFAPYLAGYLRDVTGSYQPGMLVAGLFMIASGFLVVLVAGPR
ncbi:MFS transporter [Rhodococcus sovatensis]|uniref:MFS transporter n=1 Tax=Rhodococcus sovatensis TaxID=1805840 RepID=A0ABZ2PI67_9NOCA